jgi:hypothetical protein
MNPIEISSFQTNWNRSISIQTENYHGRVASCYYLATIVTAVAFVALAVISSVFFPEYAPFMILGTFVLCAPGIELCKFFLSRAAEAKKLEEQSQKVRTYYQNFIEKKETNPEIKALHQHWKEKADSLRQNALELHQKAVSKEKEMDEKETTFLLKKYRIEALDAEKKAGAVQIYSLFLESLLEHPDSFIAGFTKHQEKLFDALPSFGTWDMRELERRAMDPKFTSKDDLFTFEDKEIKPISYLDVYKEDLKEDLKERLFLAFSKTALC